ncbi:MAG: DinB family protein [Chloroflexi bacterium]|nr:DinB family protein [Chloroflexota bacterium]MBV9543406.1 DinB family protein [Chloroflexota bacterium]
MSHRQDALRAKLVEAQRELLQTLDTVSDDDWQRVGPNNEGWSIRDLLVHLTTSEVGFVPTLKKMAAGQGGVPQDFDPNRWNAGQSRRNTEASPAMLRQQLETAHQEMLQLLETLDDTALDQRGHMSSGVDGSTEDNFLLVASHKRSHTEDMRAALSQASNVAS